MPWCTHISPKAMVHRRNLARRTISSELAEVLAAARHRLGLSVREAARRADVAVGTIVHLEKARRAPSIVVAENLIDAYWLGPNEAAMLRAEAVRGAGKDSPYKKHPTVIYGNRH